MELLLSHYLIESAKIPRDMDGYRAAVLADLHDCAVCHDNRRILDILAKEKPGCVFLVGDMISDGNLGPKYRRARALISELACRFAVYYALGNHELRWSMRTDCDVSFETFCEQLSACGVTILDNRSVIVSHGGVNVSDSEVPPVPNDSEKLRDYDFSGASRGVRVTGLSVPACYYQRLRTPILTEDKIKELVGEPDKTYFQILLAHSPRFFNSYASWGADISICGHFHGGNVRSPHFGGLISPYLDLFPKYDRGLYTAKLGSESNLARVNEAMAEIKKAYDHDKPGYETDDAIDSMVRETRFSSDFGDDEKLMLLTSGLGAHTVPRINNPPEIVIIELRSKETRNLLFAHT